jgi:hypothetical protein
MKGGKEFGVLPFKKYLIQSLSKAGCSFLIKIQEVYIQNNLTNFGSMYMYSHKDYRSRDIIKRKEVPILI